MIDLQLILIAIGLSMDAFAVSLGKGLCMKKLRYGQAAVIALFFGGFQMMMPLLGWLLGKQFAGYITVIDHWIAFVLLGGIGGKMIWEAAHDREDVACDVEDKLDIRELLLLSIATSIDALAAGVTFAFLQTAILPAVTEIGCITFALSFLGVVIGHRFGIYLKKKAEYAGGIALIFIGLEIMLSHLGILG
ncbi:MAG: manganese efflux pump MntP family protein [Eubacteriales bacterium]|nr:manganese efflux pump MntP family protein [Eubacteriales bacterium]